MMPPSNNVLETIDCTTPYPSTKYFENNHTKICESACGRYRECEGRSFTRFGYRFLVNKVGQPHEIKIHYPDDKRRFMCIMDGTSYDLNTSVMTGFTQPLSGKMLEMNIIFWPRWADCSIVFLTYGEGEPAAVADITIYELESLPPLEIPLNSLDPLPRRELAIQYEDPSGTAASEGAITRTEWVEHIIAYAKHSGQNLLMYPMVWYHGPQFPSKRELSDRTELVVTKDTERTQYLRWITTPIDWYTILLERFGQEGLEFQGALTLLRLGSLMKKMNVNLWSIRRGVDTINNMLFNDHVQAGTKSWDRIYNAINYNRISRSMKIGKNYPGFRMPWHHPGYAYGEHFRGPTHAGPIFNPLHPIVQETILGFIQEVGERYGKYPAFKGISLNMYAPSMIWFGSIHSGYDDYTVGLFEQETGIHVPVRKKDGHRFSKRYNYLTFICREAWINWRCRKIREYLGQISKTLRRCRADLRVTITMWDETVMMPVFGDFNAAHQIFARSSNFEFFREAGIDISLYSNESGLELDLGLGCTRDRGGHGKKQAGGITLSPEASSMYRDFDYLDAPLYAAVKQLEHPGAFIFNCWVESWGKHIWKKCDLQDPKVQALLSMDNKQADDILQINSLYPEDGFWWKSQLRIIPGLPAGDHFMEPYAHAVAELDACRISRGGLFLDKSHTEQLQRFAQAFRALPAVKFLPVGTSDDPVAVRTYVYEKNRYFYVINREYYPIFVKIEVYKTQDQPTTNQTSEKILDLATMKVLSVFSGFSSKDHISIPLGPYELKSFSASSTLAIDGFSLEIPAEITTQLYSDTKRALDMVTNLQANKVNIPGMEILAEQMKTALKQERYAWLRRALMSYIVRKGKKLLGMK